MSPSGYAAKKGSNTANVCIMGTKTSSSKWAVAFEGTLLVWVTGSSSDLPSQRCVFLQRKNTGRFYSQKFNSTYLSGMIVDDFCCLLYDFLKFPNVYNEIT